MSKIPSRIKKMLQVQWADIIGDIVDKIVGTNISTSMKFDGLQNDVPQVKGPDGVDLVGTKWIINGKIQWTTSESNKG